ncbi:cuticle collagen 34-like [Monodelphis domestica]|uniref:cuticle collagen 34-like n=1 Tax=Monodelphis domestica TaxID=13616 RepID=UPI0024E2714B|nr:cuticle collagen 34-like [Monodelphis domestica]
MGRLGVITNFPPAFLHVQLVAKPKRSHLAHIKSTHTPISVSSPLASMLLSIHPLPGPSLPPGPLAAPSTRPGSSSQLAEVELPVLDPEDAAASSELGGGSLRKAEAAHIYVAQAPRAAGGEPGNPGQPGGEPRCPRQPGESPGSGIPRGLRGLLPTQPGAWADPLPALPWAPGLKEGRTLVDCTLCPGPLAAACAESPVEPLGLISSQGPGPARPP